MVLELARCHFTCDNNVIWVLELVTGARIGPNGL
jgi:hypothetical protein